MKYTNEILNIALSDLQNMNIKERKKAATIIYISDSQIKKLLEILETENILHREAELLRNW